MRDMAFGCLGRCNGIVFIQLARQRINKAFDLWGACILRAPPKAPAACSELPHHRPSAWHDKICHGWHYLLNRLFYILDRFINIAFLWQEFEQGIFDRSQNRIEEIPDLCEKFINLSYVKRRGINGCCRLPRLHSKVIKSLIPDVRNGHKAFDDFGMKA